MTKSSTTSASAVSRRAPLTVLSAFERLLELSTDSKLSATFYRKAKPYTDYLCDVLKITPVQAVFLAVILNGDRDEIVYQSTISRTLGCTNIFLLTQMSGLAELERRGMVTMRNHGGDRGYRVPDDVLDAMQRNECYVRATPTSLDNEDLIARFDNLVNKRDEDEISVDTFIHDVIELINCNQQLCICRALKAMNLSGEDLALVVFFIVRLVGYNDDNIILNQFSDIFSGAQLSRIKRTFSLNSNVLVKKKIVEPVAAGITDGRNWRLSNKACRKLLPEYKLQRNIEATDVNLLVAKDIVAKQMYYNNAEKAQVNRLRELLSKDNFAEICKRMMAKGMRTGFSCIFYGAPGTGKTETVYQLAKATGRDVMVVDISQVKSKWVGESEKNVQEIFDRYRSLVNGRKIAPILLFNEADAVLGTRITNVTQSVDKMNNAIQNIILQEMERLDGILIATTNLTENLDAAFERRFLFKIKFERPCLEAKSSIWRAMIPELSEEQAAELAEKYSFSGGQIENIARKKAIDDILAGHEGVDMAIMHGFCQCELLDNKTSAQVGFRCA